MSFVAEVSMEQKGSGWRTYVYLLAATRDEAHAELAGWLRREGIPAEHLIRLGADAAFDRYTARWLLSEDEELALDTTERFWRTVASEWTPAEVALLERLASEPHPSRAEGI